MLTLTPTMRIWLAIEPTDMRLSFRGLAGKVRSKLLDDPLSGHLFCFVNRRRNMVKMLLFDRTGYWIFHKRLSLGTFEAPSAPLGATKIRLDPSELSMLLEGIELTSPRRRRWRLDERERPNN